ncbi:2-methylcitrate dehydratase PrpD [Amycolatopsis echigonensis]|uniref:2-methylcitrate dehydratase PrpD n=1 Tax=Amycolatopsis echigonensis TaxID=2576905 RepID=A0A2N3WTM7_9PSEU|nr:MmgE/PrpD family protein [Amycolatopsis niigatensis]PKV97237.1 2-methylcitrate dehydratase PrpD [Amycolatopsis niigatensis]
MATIIEQLAAFAAGADARGFPDDVVRESQRILLDSLGCAVASLDDEGAQRGVDYARYLGGSTGPASILGTGTKTSVPAAAFANAELINALDQDAVLPPGHVTPYVLPGALATAESLRVSGAKLLEAIAVAHEMSYRIGKATDYLRDIKDGVVTIPDIIGYSSTLFGAAAAVGVVKGFDSETLADALGIMGSTAPTNTQRAWMMHAPATTIKYQLAGGMALSAVTAANLAERGHTGDRQMLDDREYGFPRFIGTSRWEPAPITADLGSQWTFTPFQSFKPYPHCRVMHALFDALTEIVETNDLRPDEIDAITAYGESFVQQPVWVNETIRNPRDAQFSMTHGLALAAHRIAPGKDWQTPEAVLNPSVLDLTKKAEFKAHPDYTEALKNNPAARRSLVEVQARGTTYRGERAYPKGSPSPDPATYMTDDELVAKFRHNVEGVVADPDAIVQAVFDLRNVEEVSALLNQVKPGGAA